MNTMDTGDSKQQLAERRAQSERAIQRRLVAHVAAGRTTDMAPATLRLPATVYTDPVRLIAERSRIFLQRPLLAGLSCDIPAPGDVALFDGAGPSIILTRRSDGSVAAFRNMCTHRGARLVRECGHHAAITCPFHGWSFDHDGRLVGQPGSAAFEGIDKDQLGLIRLPCAEKHGLIFVSAQHGGAEIDVDALLGPLAPEMEALDLGSMALMKQGPLFTAGNWKYVFDTFGEGYHFAALHPDTLGSTHYSNVAAYDAFGPHFRICFPQKLYAKLRGLPEAQWPGIDSVVYVLFPNVAIVVGSPQPGLMVVQVFRLFPQDVGQTRVDLAVYAPAAMVSAQTRPLFEAGFDLASRIVQNEDFRMSAEALQNLQHAPEHFSVVFGRNEPALQHMQGAIAEACGMPL